MAHRLFLILLILNAVFRVGLLAEFGTKELGLHELPMRDMNHYYSGAQMILEGDYRLVGLYENYQLCFDLLGGREEFSRLNRGAQPLTQAPLYSYLLAGSLKLTGGVFLVRVLQVAAGLLIAWLTFLLARRVLGEARPAMVAGLLVAYHPTLVFYEAFLLRATLLTALGLLYVLALARYVEAPSRRSAAGVGVALGVLHLTKTTLVVYAPWIVLAFVLQRKDWRRRAGEALILVAAFLAIISPLLVRSVVCETPLLHNEGWAHLNVIAYNHPHADGVHLIYPSRAHYAQVLSNSGPSLLSTVFASIAAFPGVGDWLRLMLTKLFSFWNGYEGPNNVSIYDYRHVLRSLSLFPCQSTAILTLALGGALLGLRRLARTWPAYLGLITILIPCLASSSMARYRLPAIPFFAIFAASFAFALLGAERRRRLQGAVLLGAGLLLAFPRGPERITTPRAYEAHRSIGMGYTQAGDPRRALRHALNAINAHPLSAAPPAGLDRFPDTPEWKEYVALHRWANDMALRAGDQQAVLLIRQSLARHLAPGR